MRTLLIASISLFLALPVTGCDFSQEAKARKVYLYCLRFNKNCDKERAFWQAQVKKEGKETTPAGPPK